MLDLLNPTHAYFFGFVQGDGHLGQEKANPNKGKLEIELASKDRELLEKFNQIFSNSSLGDRTRTTNFSKNYESSTWRLCDFDFRQSINALGVPYGKKSELISTPEVDYSRKDYWRGLIDADGSLGFTSQGVPFVSLVTSSETIARAFEDVIFETVGLRKFTNRNKRDEVFNISVFREDAVELSGYLYYEGCFALTRKLQSASAIVAWKRSENMRPRYRLKKWSTSEDKIVMENTPTNAAKLLNRTVSSVGVRKWRLKQFT